MPTDLMRPAQILRQFDLIEIVRTLVPVPGADPERAGNRVRIPRNVQFRIVFEILFGFFVVGNSAIFFRRSAAGQFRVEAGLLPEVPQSFGGLRHFFADQTSVMAPEKGSFSGIPEEI